MVERVLSKGELGKLVELLHPVRVKWYQIGLQLGLHSGDLDAIRDSGSDAYPYQEMLKQWLAKNQSPTLKALSTALRTNAVGERRLGLSILSPPLKAVPTDSHSAAPLPCSPVTATDAQGDSSLNISSKPLQAIENTKPVCTSTPRAEGNCPHTLSESALPDTPIFATQDSGISLGSPSFFNCKCGNCTFDTYSARGCPEGSFPYLDTSSMSVKDRQQFESRLQSETNEITRFFDDVTIATLKSFQRSQVSLHVISTHVKNLRPSIKPMNKRSSCRLTWKSMEECFSHLASYWSWFNTHILEQLVKHHGTEEDTERMALYLEARRVFLERNIFNIPQDAYGDKREENSKQLVLKLANTGYNVSEMEATVLEQLQTLVYETLQKYVELLNVRKGCLEMTFQIPDQDVPHLSQDQKSTLSQKGVLSLTIEGEVYFQDTSDLENMPPHEDSALSLNTTPGNYTRKRSSSEDYVRTYKEPRRESPRRKSSPQIYRNTQMEAIKKQSSTPTYHNPARIKAF